MDRRRAVRLWRGDDVTAEDVLRILIWVVVLVLVIFGPPWFRWFVAISLGVTLAALVIITMLAWAIGP